MANVSLSTEETPACPFAKALRDEQQSEARDGNDHASLLGLRELQSCPAFNNNECPFKGLAAEEVTQKLKQIPPSHLQSHGTFYKFLEFFHRHHQPVQTDVGGCPVKHALPADWSFDQAMEEYSLAAIMGNLAREWEDHATPEGESSGSEDEGSSRSLAAAGPQAATSTATVANTSKRTNLSQALKSGTAVAHEAAESVHFVKNFIRGKIDRNLYALLVAQLLHVYAKLEDALDAYAPTYFAKCHFSKELRRTPALQEDVEFWHTTSNPPVSPAAKDYLDRIDYLAANQPLLLLSHAYTRYMGDLSGGKVLARVARRALNLTADDMGLAFYHFEHVQSFKLFKDQYRASLNALDLTEDQISELVQEANVAFLLNMRLFEELDVVDNVPGASVRPLHEVYHLSKKSSSDGGSNSDLAQCPFAFKASSSDMRMDTQQFLHHPPKEGVCPWPFILLHDPAAGMKRWQTGLVIGLVVGYVYHLYL